FPVSIRIRGGEVLEERVDVLVEREAVIALLARGLDDFRTHGSLELLDREDPVLVLVAEVEDLDDPLIELLPVHLAVVVLVVFLEPLLQVRRGSRLSGCVAHQENAECCQRPEVAVHNGHSVSPHQLSIFQLPSGWRHAVPYPFSCLLSIVTVVWYSRQYCPFDWYVRTGVTVPECPLSGLFHATGFPDGVLSIAF